MYFRRWLGLRLFLDRKTAIPLPCPWLRLFPDRKLPFLFPVPELANSCLCLGLLPHRKLPSLFPLPELANCCPWSRPSCGCSLLASRHPSSLSPSSLGDGLGKILKYFMNGILYLVPTPMPPRIIFAIHGRNWLLISNLVLSRWLMWRSMHLG